MQTVDMRKATMCGCTARRAPVRNTTHRNATLVGALLLATCHVALADVARPWPRVVNGLPSTSFPQVGAILSVTGAEGGERLGTTCTGTLIGCATVITAAHCVCPDEADNAADCTALGLADPAGIFVFFQQAGYLPVESVVIHPGYQFAVASDLAILKLAVSVSGFPPLPINDVASPASGTPGTIVGFGTTADDRFDAGIKRYGGVITAGCAGLVPGDTHVCWEFVAPIGAPGDDSNTCHGDSGGPLFTSVEGQPVLAGVTSGGYPTCSADALSFDTNVYFDREWIHAEAGADLGGERCGDLSQVGEFGTTVASVGDGTLSQAQPEGELTIEVPEKTALLRVTLNGQDESDSFMGVLGANDFDLYVRFGHRPTGEAFDCVDPTAGTYGMCEIKFPEPGTWHVTATRFAGQGGFQLTATAFSQAPPTRCVGDCGNDGQVTVDEILTMVNIALGNADVSDCDSGDVNNDGQITVDEILTAVNAALSGCATPDVSGTRQRDQAVIRSSTCAAAVTEGVQDSIDAGEWNCTYEIAQSGQDLTITETCPDGTDIFPGTVDTAGRITVVRIEQETENSCTFTQTTRLEANGAASTSTGVGRLQFDFSTGCAFADCEIVVESRFSRL